MAVCSRVKYRKPLSVGQGETVKHDRMKESRRDRDAETIRGLGSAGLVNIETLYEDTKST